MFFTLLIVTLLLSLAVTFIVVTTFDKSIGRLLSHIIQDQISEIWQKYIKFVAYVVGISSGVRIYKLEGYISARYKDAVVLELNKERWVLEVYGTIIETLQGLAWMYFIAFIFMLIAYVVLKCFDSKAKRTRDLANKE